MDRSLLTLINQSWTNGWLDFMMVALTTVGLAFCVFITGLAWWKEQRQLALALLLAQMAALVGVVIFYEVALRTRPEAVRLIMAAPPLPSFPSGHAAIAAATAMVYWLHNGWTRRSSAILLLAAGVSYSRIYLGHHFPSDVAAGIIWGMGVGAAAHGVSHFWGERRLMLRWLLWPQASFALMVTIMAYLGLLPLYLLKSWPYYDKALHLLLVGALAFWLNLWAPDLCLRLGKWRVPVAILLPFAVATVEELLQQLSPMRTFDLFDLASDLAGLLLFYALSRWVLARMSSEAVVVRERV